MAAGDRLINADGTRAVRTGGTQAIQTAAGKPCCCAEISCGCGSRPPSAFNIAISGIDENPTSGVARQIKEAIGTLNISIIVPYIGTYHYSQPSQTFEEDVCLYACQKLISEVTNEDGSFTRWFIIADVWMSSIRILCSIRVFADGKTASGEPFAVGYVYGGVGAGKFWTAGDPQDCDGPIVMDANVLEDWGSGGTVTLTASSGGGGCEFECYSCPCPCRDVYCLTLRLDDDGRPHVIRALFRRISPSSWHGVGAVVDGTFERNFFLWITCDGDPADPGWVISWVDQREGNPLGYGSISATASGCPNEATDWTLVSASIETISLTILTVVQRSPGQPCPTDVTCDDLGDKIALAMTRRAISCSGSIAATSYVRHLDRDSPGVNSWSGDENGWEVNLTCDESGLTITAAKDGEDWVLESVDGISWVTTGGSHTLELCVEKFLANAIIHDTGVGCLGCPEDTGTISGTASGTYDDVIPIAFVDYANCTMASQPPYDPNVLRIFDSGNGYAYAIYEPNGFGTSPHYEHRKLWINGPDQCPATGAWYLWSVDDGSLPNLSLS